MKNMNFLRAGELHRRVGRQAAQQDRPVGCTLRRACGLHNKMAYRKGWAGGLPFSAVHPTLFWNPPDRLFVQPAILSSVQPAESSRFLFGNTVTEPPGKSYGIKIYFANAVFHSYPIHSVRTEANHLGFTKPSSCLLLWCNYLLEAASLRHNRNSSGNNNGTFMHPND